MSSNAVGADPLRQQGTHASALAWFASCEGQVFEAGVADGGLAMQAAPSMTKAACTASWDDAEIARQHGRHPAGNCSAVRVDAQTLHPSWQARRAAPRIKSTVPSGRRTVFE